jgi:hypothetical protein
MGILTNLLKLSWEEADRRRNSEIEKWQGLFNAPGIRPEFKEMAIDELVKLAPKQAGGFKDIGNLFKGLVGKARQDGGQQRLAQMLASTGRPGTTLNIPGGSQVPPQTTTMGGGPGGPMIGGQPVAAPPEISTTRPGFNMGDVVQPSQSQVGPVRPSYLLSPQEQLNAGFDKFRAEEQMREGIQDTIAQHKEERDLETRAKKRDQDYADLNRFSGMYQAGGYPKREADERAAALVGVTLPPEKEFNVPNAVEGSDSKLLAWGRANNVPIDPTKQYTLRMAGDRIVDAFERPPAKGAGGGLIGPPGELANAHEVINDYENAKRTGRKSRFTVSQYQGAKDFVTKYDRPPTTVIQMAQAESQVADIVRGIENGTIPPDALSGYGMSKVAPQGKALLAKHGYNLSRAILDWRATEAHYRSLNSVQQVRLREATGYAAESLSLLSNPDNRGDDLIGQLRNLVPRTKFPVLNSAALLAARHGTFGDAAASAATQIENQITELQSELATVYKGGNSPTDIGIGQAMKILAGEWSENVLRDGVDLARKNLQLRLNSIRNVTPVTPEGGGIYAPTTPAPPVSTTPINRAAGTGPVTTGPTGAPQTMEEFNKKHPIGK